ncbi:MAG TPA: hypothetical protein VEC16_02700 [Alphaproteobacteria bacterium]|nr:hypothetical protein [Alphaproteobacteria bacterium]
MNKKKTKISRTENPEKFNFSNDKTVRVILIIIMIIALGILLSTIAYTIYKTQANKDIIKYTEVYTSAEVAGNPGLNADPDGLKFGKVPPGASGIRYLDINTSENAIVELYISGELAKYMTVDESMFEINAGESKRIPFYLHIPDTVPLGLIEGKVVVIIRRAEE